MSFSFIIILFLKLGLSVNAFFFLFLIMLKRFRVTFFISCLFIYCINLLFIIKDFIHAQSEVSFFKIPTHANSCVILLESHFVFVTQSSIYRPYCVFSLKCFELELVDQTLRHSSRPLSTDEVTPRRRRPFFTELTGC